MNIAVITGASSGLGCEYLQQISKKFPSLDEIWIIARRKNVLCEYAKKIKNVKIVPIALDLSLECSYYEYERLLCENKPDIKILINNAGFGCHGEFAKSNYKSQTAMIDVNCKALVAMSSISLNYMKSGSFIINISSIAAFAPNPNLTVYSATKSFVKFFSQGLRYELKERKINCLAVCPGPMNTDFMNVANITGNSRAFEILPYCSVNKVVSKSLHAAAKGESVYVNKPFYKLYRIVSKLLPNDLTINFSKT